MIEAKHLSAGYPGKPVLSDVSFTVPQGQITVILGPNGCGKSTLLKALCGILPADSGEITINVQNISALPPKALARQVAYLAQSRQVPDITARRMVLHGRFPYLGYPRRYSREDLAIAQAAMKQMGIESLADTPLSALSGGQRQKVYLAMALAQNTPVILLDEPTTYLDVAHQLQMMEHANYLCREGKTVVMVLHDLSMALQTAHRVILMDQGSIVLEGTAEKIFQSGCLDRVFGVKVRRVQTPGGWHYYCEGGGV